ncbi:MAG: hypothetical protein OXG44_06060 [Gammaproteobacteria bacterium]|nr:hypothetical protein [Gammaproteobacteria bacterium]
MTEEEFQAALVGRLRIAGWSVYHPYDSRRSQQGYPDLTVWAANRGVWWAELKREPVRETVRDLNGVIIARTRKPQIAAAQLQTLRDLPTGRAVILVPSDMRVLETLAAQDDWDRVLKVLARRLDDPGACGLRIGR